MCHGRKITKRKIPVDRQALSLVVETLKVTPAIPSNKPFDWGWIIKGFWGDGENEDVTNKGLKLFGGNPRRTSKHGGDFGVMLSATIQLEDIL